MLLVTQNTLASNNEFHSEFNFDSLFHIFEILSPTDQSAATITCKAWQAAGEAQPFKDIREFCFGKAKWNKYFGDIGTEPPIPLHIQCFVSNKRKKDTHALILVPETVNGRPHSLNSLSKLIQVPKIGNAPMGKIHIAELIDEEVMNKSLPSHWILITNDIVTKPPRDAIRNTNDLSIFRNEQKEALANAGYFFPKALEAATANSIYYVQMGNYSYRDVDNKDNSITKRSVTLCEEKILDIIPIAVGNIYNEQLYIDDAFDHLIGHAVTSTRGVLR